MVVYVKMTKKEKQLAKDYAKRNGLSLSAAMKESFFEKIEDEYDIALAESSIKEYEKNHLAYTHEEVVKELGIDSNK